MCLCFEEQSTDDKQDGRRYDDTEDDDDRNERVGRCNRVLYGQC